MYGNNYYPNGGQGPVGWNQGGQGQAGWNNGGQDQGGWNQAPQMQPPLIYHFRGLRIDEAWPNGLGRRAFVMRPRTYRENRPNEYPRGNHHRSHRNSYRGALQPVNNRDEDQDEYAEAPADAAEIVDYRCFICGELMQNSEEQGVHLCVGDTVRRNGQRQEAQGQDGPGSEDKEERQSDLASLEELLGSLRKAMRNAAAVKTLGSCVQNLDLHQKTIDKELERLMADFGKQAEASARRIYRCLLVIRQNFAAWRILVQKAAEETQRREGILTQKEHKVECKEKEVIQQRLDDEQEIKRQIQELEDEKERMSQVHETQKVGYQASDSHFSKLTKIKSANTPLTLPVSANTPLTPPVSANTPLTLPVSANTPLTLSVSSPLASITSCLYDRRVLMLKMNEKQ